MVLCSSLVLELVIVKAPSVYVKFAAGRRVGAKGRAALLAGAHDLVTPEMFGGRFILALAVLSCEVSLGAEQHVVALLLLAWV